jgi:UDP-N-acetylmuramoyl-tripeptide--D-alanyl-D-alanine ligase
MIFNIESTHDIAILEMGMNNFGEISRLSKTARPDIALIINIGESHIGNLGSRDGIFKAKREILDYLKEDGHVFLNGDDDMLVTLESSKLNSIFFGNNSTNDCFVKQILQADQNKTRMIVQYQHQQFELTIPVGGNYMIYPTLAAVSIAKSLGLKDSEIQKGVASYKTVGSRNKIIETDKLTIIDDVYNACKDSIIVGVKLLLDTKTQGKRVAIIGDVFELGEYSAKIHYEIGKAIANEAVDLFLCVGKDAFYINKAIVENSNKKSLYYETQEKMLAVLLNYIDENDTVYVKASRGMKLENTVEFLRGL